MNDSVKGLKPSMIIMDDIVEGAEPYHIPLKLNFPGQISMMNKMYDLPVESGPTIDCSPNELSDRLDKFKSILSEELDEIDAITNDNLSLGCMPTKLDVLVAMADLLGDLTVYIRSEAMKYGIPLEEVLDIIMQSNFSKLGADGKPIKDERGKFLKGPGYWKPEPKIRELLEREIAANNKGAE